MSAFGHSFGLVAALLYVCLLVGIYALRDRWQLHRLLSGRKACIISITIVLFLLLIFGLTPQDGSRDSISGVLGFRDMSLSPIFILALLLLATTVTLNTIEDIHRFTRHRLGVTCAHLGLSVILVAGLFGTGDTVQARMIAMPNEPDRQAWNESTDEYIKLPFELTLKDFSVHKYSSEVTLTLPDGRSSEIKIAVNHPAKVGSWRIYQSDYLSDTERGEFASIFKCVYSPMSEVLRIALWLLLVSAAAMVFFSGFKPRFGKESSSEKKSLGQSDLSARDCSIGKSKEKEGRL
ncbi:MAG TPA: hypothetical protein DDX40_05215 [Rikenellaceae bacterium]|nr:hypothetical protein [Rikenellaceae bacterium]